ASSSIRERLTRPTVPTWIASLPRWITRSVTPSAWLCCSTQPSERPISVPAEAATRRTTGSVRAGPGGAGSACPSVITNAIAMAGRSLRRDRSGIHGGLRNRADLLESRPEQRRDLHDRIRGVEHHDAELTVADPGGRDVAASRLVGEASLQAGHLRLRHAG